MYPDFVGCPGLKAPVEKQHEMSIPCGFILLNIEIAESAEHSETPGHTY
jgi:hypothetical protein